MEQNLDAELFLGKSLNWMGKSMKILYKNKNLNPN
jgi:hypothetical protein